MHQKNKPGSAGPSVTGRTQSSREDRREAARLDGTLSSDNKPPEMPDVTW